MKKKIGFGVLCFLIALGVSIVLTIPDVKDTADYLKTNYIEATTVNKVTDPFTNLIEEKKDWLVQTLEGS
ncbi:hypothetical protein PWEIH_00215 [Listeria weihenstephanensis FSL R9-0317]|uniref:Uncharacterized protein n=1 Tax=Listeria weihenstephanensis TaxID=1006155 RepID=A0A1S7FSR7_9LIST|nr:hypothetical protein [Listeria weihenstephanensis]AQY50432.1 hypothetical protein UE46_04900 [Listeria weihenstephanensis]EUJ41443.1 hypothetical protein PWEIH_00215 [Listeria weihenstephanensis FSL R9-0317]MBC1501584.1 hypothetical protein [Listeria weihenstephanensis]